MHAATHDNPYKAALKEYVHKTYAPTVLVLPTSPAEAITRKSDLSFIDLLRPCSKVDTSSVHVNTTRDVAYRIPELFLHFVADSEVEHKPEEFVEIIVDSVVRSSAEEAKRSVSQIRNKEDAARELDEMGRDNHLVPWFTDYRNEFVRGLRFSDHEYFDHPLAVILVAASDEEDVVVKFTSLFARDALPGLYREGVLDPNMLKHYVLLHDNTLDAAAAQKAADTLRLMRDTFGSGASSLIRVNSIQPGARPPVDIWTPCRPHVAGDAPPSAPRGGLMSQEDMDGISRFVSDFAVQALVPHMDKRVRSLNQAVTAARKGFKNQFKSWGTSLFGHKSGESGREGFVEGSEATGPKYLYNSTEGQIRALADLAFMLYDHDLALSNYKLVQGDYKRDRAWRHVAGASEMAALCHLMLGQDGKRSPQDESMEAAFANYSKLKLMRFAARATMLHADMLRARGRFVEAAEKLIRCTATDTNDLRSALLYEQSAISFLQVEPWGHVRKYALHLVHAGHRYLKAGHKAHGLRCYLSALRVYESKGWTHLDDHLFSALAKHSIGMNLIEEAVQFYVKLLDNQEKKPEDRQRIYLRDFIAVIRQHCPDKVVTSLRLPLVHDSLLSVTMSEPSLELFGRQSEEHAPPQAMTRDSALSWGLLEEALCDERRWRERVRQSRSSLQNLRAALPDPAPRNDRCVVVGEDTLIQVTISNPLQVPLELHDLSLAYSFSSSAPPEHDPSSDAGKPAAGADDADVEWGDEGGDLDVEKKEVVLGAGEKTVVTLRMRALKEGWLHVRGVRWKLGGVVKCVHLFKLKGRRLNLSKADRTSRNYQRDERLEMRAVPAMPRLELQLHGMPPTAMHGEIVLASLQVLNTGSRPVKRLRLACSHPCFFSVGTQDDLDSKFPSALLSEGKSGGAQALETSVATKWWADVDYSPASDFDPPVMELALGDEGGLAPGAVVNVPLWCRAQRPGAHTFRMLLHYEPPDPDSKMRYRLLGQEAAMAVVPSCRASVHMRSCVTAVDKLTLAVQVEGPAQQQAEQEALYLRQVSCVSSHFVATRLSGGGGGSEMPAITERGKSVMYYRLQPPHSSKNKPAPDDDQREHGRKSIVSTFVVGGSGAELELGAAPLRSCLEQWEQRRLAAAHAQEAAAQSAREAADRGRGSGEGGGDKQRVGETDTRVVVVWQNKEGTRMGVVHVACGETDGPARGDQDATVLHHEVKMEAALAAREGTNAITKLAINTLVDKHRPCPLQVRLQVPSQVGLPRRGMACVVPVSVVLWNDDFDRPLHVVFEALPPGSSDSTDEAGKVHGASGMPTGIVHRAWDYEWGGSLRVSLTVPARAEGTVPLSASLFRPGVYNLNRFRVSFPSDPFPAQDFHLPSSNFQRLVHVQLED